MAIGKICFSFAIILCLCACGKQEPTIQYVDRPVTVEVPVMVQPEFTRPRKPVYYTNKLTWQSTPKEIAEAYVNTILELKRYSRSLNSRR